jgi:hypothetical protein
MRIVLTLGIVGALWGLALAPVVWAAPALTLSTTRLIFSVPAGSASGPRTATIRNTGDATLSITSVTIGGANASQFQLVSPPALPASVAPSGELNVQVRFNPPGGANGAQGATLQIASNAGAGEVTLRGLATKGNFGSNEPSLQQIFDTYQIPVDVGDDDNTTNTFSDSPVLHQQLNGGEEIPGAQQFVKANGGPVSVEPIAVYGPGNANPVVRFGWYSGSCALANGNELFSVSNSPSSNAQRLEPVLNAGAQLSFDPGSAPFGFSSIWPFFSSTQPRCSADAANTWESDPLKRHKLRVYPLRNPNGSAVANAYIVATEEQVNGTDYQDVVVIVRNARPAPLATTLEFNQTYPGTLPDKDNQPTGFITTQRNKNDLLRPDGSTPATDSYSPAQIDINPGTGRLTLTTTRTSSAQGGQWNNLKNALQLPFDGTSTPFTVTTRIVGPLSQLTTNSQQAGIFFGPDQRNFTKIIVARLSNANVIEFYRETNDDIDRSTKVPLPSLSSIEYVDLLLIGQPGSGSVRGAYRIKTVGADAVLQFFDSESIPAGQRSAYFNARSWAGITASGREDSTPIISFAFERFAIEGAAQPQPTATTTATATSGTATTTATATGTATATATGTGTATGTATTPTSPVPGTKFQRVPLILRQ